MEKNSSVKTMAFYSTMEEVELEEGDAKGETLDKFYWFVKETEDGRYEVHANTRTRARGPMTVSPLRPGDKNTIRAEYYRKSYPAILQKSNRR